MRTKRLIDGLDNTQKIRIIVNDFHLYCKVKDILNIGNRDHRVAVWEALNKIGVNNIVAKHKNEPGITGFGSNRNGINLQVDLI